MATGSTTGTPVIGVTYVWTFIIRGGEPFNLTLKDKIGPPLRHGAGRTIWKMVGTDKDAASVEDMVAGPLIGAEVERFTDAESDEEREIRLERLGLAVQEG